MEVLRNIVGGRARSHPHNPPGGGEQGDAMMPLLSSLGQHRALQLVQDEASTSFLGRHVSCHISRENHDSMVVTVLGQYHFRPILVFRLVNKC